MANINDLKEGDVVYLNAQPEIKFTVRMVYKPMNRVEVVYYNGERKSLEYPKFKSELLTKDEPHK